MNITYDAIFNARYILIIVYPCFFDMLQIITDVNTIMIVIIKSTIYDRTTKLIILHRSAS